MSLADKISVFVKQQSQLNSTLEDYEAFMERFSETMGGCNAITRAQRATELAGRSEPAFRDRQALQEFVNAYSANASLIDTTNRVQRLADRATAHPYTEILDSHGELFSGSVTSPELDQSSPSEEYLKRLEADPLEFAEFGEASGHILACDGCDRSFLEQNAHRLADVEFDNDEEELLCGECRDATKGFD